jgi:hypothetical protein
MQSYLDLSNVFLAKIVLTLDSTTSVGKVILQADWTHGYRQNLGSDTTCDTPKTGTLQMIALLPQSTRCRFGNAPPSTSCTLQHARDTGGIKVATDTQVHNGTHKRMYNITTKTPRVKNLNIHTKIQIIHKAK